MQGLILFVVWYFCFVLYGSLTLDWENATNAWIFQQVALIVFEAGMTIFLIYLIGPLETSYELPDDVGMPSLDEYLANQGQGKISRKMSWFPSWKELFHRRPQPIQQWKGVARLGGITTIARCKLYMKVFVREILLSAICFSFAAIRSASKGSRKFHALNLELEEFDETGDTDGVDEVLDQQVKSTPSVLEKSDLFLYAFRVSICLVTMTYMWWRTRKIEKNPHENLILIGNYMTHVIDMTDKQLSGVNHLHTKLLLEKPCSLGETQKILRGQLEFERQNKYYFKGQFKALQNAKYPLHDASANIKCELLVRDLAKSTDKCGKLEEAIILSRIKNEAVVSRVVEMLREKVGELRKTHEEFETHFIKKDKDKRSKKVKLNQSLRVQKKTLKKKVKMYKKLEKKNKYCPSLALEIEWIGKRITRHTDRLMLLNKERDELGKSAKFLLNSWISKIEEYQHYLEGEFQMCRKEHINKNMEEKA